MKSAGNNTKTNSKSASTKSATKNPQHSPNGEAVAAIVAQRAAIQTPAHQVNEIVQTLGPVSKRFREIAKHQKENAIRDHIRIFNVYTKFEADTRLTYESKKKFVNVDIGTGISDEALKSEHKRIMKEIIAKGTQIGDVVLIFPYDDFEDKYSRTYNTDNFISAHVFVSRTQTVRVDIFETFRHEKEVLVFPKEVTKFLIENEIEITKAGHELPDLSTQAFLVRPKMINTILKGSFKNEEKSKWLYQYYEPKLQDLCLNIYANVYRFVEPLKGFAPGYSLEL